MNWTDSLGKHPAPVQEFLLDRVGPDKQKSQEREDFGGKFVAMLKTWCCEVFNSDEDGWLWDKDQQYVKKTYAAQLLAKPSWNLGGLVFCDLSAVYVKDTLCRFAGQDARGILIRWLFLNFQRFCVKVARASCKFPLVLWCRPFEALDPDKRITAEDDRHWELGTFSLPVFVADVKIWLWREALRHHFVEDPKALKAAGKKVGMIWDDLGWVLRCFM